MTKDSTKTQLTLGCLALAAVASPLHAGLDWIWTGPAAQSSWQSSGNWTPIGIPGIGDTVGILQDSDVRLNTDTSLIASLQLSGGGVLNTNTHLLKASDMVSIGAGGRLEAMFAFGDTAVYTPRVLLPLGGKLDLLGGIVHATDTFHSQGLITGHGTLRLDTVAAPIFRSEGTITSTGVIEIDSPNGTVVLDGAINVEEDAGLVVNAGATVIDGSLFMTDGSSLDVTGLWSLNSYYDIDSGTGAAELNGGPLTIEASAQGTLAGTVALNAALTLKSQMFCYGTIDFGDAAFVGDAGRINLDGATLTGSEITLQNTSSKIHGHGLVAVEQIYNEGQIVAHGGTLIIDTVAAQPDLDGDFVGHLAVHTGDLEIRSSGGAAYDVTVSIGEGRELRMPNFTLALNGNSFPPPQYSNYIRLRGGAVIGGGVIQTMYSGPIEVQASPEESRLVSSADTFLAGDVGLEGNLRVEGDTHLRPTVNMYGPGLLTVGETGRLQLQPGANPDVAIQNEGEIVVGAVNEIGVNAFGRFLEQEATGTLSFEFEDFGDVHDRLSFDGIARLGGTLKVTGIDTTNLTQPMTILTAAGLEGTFEHVELPDGATMLYSATGVVVQPAGVCAADINSDGVINFSDVIEVLNGWGTCCGCPADVTGEGNVNITDLIQVLAAWGDCE